MKLAPYPEYKESGSPAAPKIPGQWAVHRCRYLFREVDERSKDGQETHLSMSQKHGLIDSSKIDKWRLQSESYTGGKICKDGDLVLNRLKAHLGVFAHAKQSGVVSPDYTVLRPITDDNPRFFELLFKSPLFITEFTKSTKGIVKGFWRLYTDDFYSIRAVVPPPEEQQQILRFIDSLTARANKFIRNKRRLIELLKEQKQHVINQAVTRGLDPKVKFKPSGVEWIGDIPEHWAVRRLRFLSKGMLQYGANEQSGQKDLDCPRYVRITDIKDGGELREDTLCTISKDIAKAYLLREGDILFARSGATVGKTFCYQRSWGEAAYAGYLIRAKIDATIIRHEFVFQFTRSRAYSNWIGSSFIKATIQNISAEKYASLWITLPPRGEQKSILEFIKRESEVIDQAIARAEREIELMREYRTRLISDVVTGQVDLRGIEVPQVAEEELLALEEDTADADDVIGDEGDTEDGE